MQGQAHHFVDYQGRGFDESGCGLLTHHLWNSSDGSRVGTPGLGFVAGLAVGVVCGLRASGRYPDVALVYDID